MLKDGRTIHSRRRHIKLCHHRLATLFIPSNARVHANRFSQLSSKCMTALLSTDRSLIGSCYRYRITLNWIIDGDSFRRQATWYMYKFRKQLSVFGNWMQETGRRAPWERGCNCWRASWPIPSRLHLSSFIMERFSQDCWKPEPKQSPVDG